MASLTHHYNRKTGVTYVYSVESYWDKEKKRPANKQVCLGRVDKETGEVIPSKSTAGTAKRAASAPRVTAKALVAGPHLLLERLTEQTGLGVMLKKCFPDIHAAMLSMVYFIVQKGLALSHCGQWSSGHLHPYGDIMLSQWISDLLPRIPADARQQFLSLWLGKLPDKDYRCYAMTTTMQSLGSLGSAVIHFVLDSGSYSEGNVDELFRRKRKFTIAVPDGRK